MFEALLDKRSPIYKKYFLNIKKEYYDFENYIDILYLLYLRENNKIVEKIEEKFLNETFFKNCQEIIRYQKSIYEDSYTDYKESLNVANIFKEFGAPLLKYPLENLEYIEYLLESAWNYPIIKKSNELLNIFHVNLRNFADNFYKKNNISHKKEHFPIIEMHHSLLIAFSIRKEKMYEYIPNLFITHCEFKKNEENIFDFHVKTSYDPKSLPIYSDNSPNEFDDNQYEMNIDEELLEEEIYFEDKGEQDYAYENKFEDESNHSLLNF